jgi:hypothetical protein
VWINPFPDFPLLFRQVTPADFSENGLQARGGFYVGPSPVKMEYSLYVTNGMGLPDAAPSLTQIANLGDITDSPDNVNGNLAFGGRLGFVVPEYGLWAGVSALFNGAYTAGGGDYLNIWQLDAAWRYGNWDVRGEFAQMFQQAESLIGNNIQRNGLYAQVGYRPYDACSFWLQKTEFLFRYSFARFKGIDGGALDLADFATTIDVPVDRNQYTFGVDYWAYPSLVFKLAYEINEELGSVKFNDNAFLVQFAWGF